MQILDDFTNQVPLFKRTERGRKKITHCASMWNQWRNYRGKQNEMKQNKVKWFGFISNNISSLTGERMERTFFLNRGSNPVRWTQSPTLYHVAIKAALYRKAVQVYHIPIPVVECRFNAVMNIIFLFSFFFVRHNVALSVYILWNGKNVYHYGLNIFRTVISVHLP